jgi:hypothetical protein
MESTPTLLGAWDQYMYIGAAACIALGILILLYHEFRLLQIKDYKEKYDYVNLHEVSYFWYAVMAFILAGAFAANTIATETIQQKGMMWFYARTFIIISLTLIAYFTFSSLVKIYYPKQLAKRLTKIRTKPRISPDGNVMRRLSEAEEDHHLEASQIEDEKMQVVDYDVWIDEKTGYKKIEKYLVSEQAEECPECGYYTFKIASEEIEVAPTELEKGMFLEHYKCSYCGHREQREMEVAKLSMNV